MDKSTLKTYIGQYLSGKTERPSFTICPLDMVLIWEGVSDNALTITELIRTNQQASLARALGELTSLGISQSGSELPC